MRYLLTVLPILLMECGSGSGQSRDDLSKVDDLASPPADLASQAPDFSVAICNSPKPIDYFESLQYSYVQVGSGAGPTNVFSITQVAVQNDGSFVRPKTPLSSPALYHCSFARADIDKNTCTVPCCPGSADDPQPFSPVVYVDSNGWALWTTGSCSFSINSAKYAAQIVQVNTNAAH